MRCFNSGLGRSTRGTPRPKARPPSMEQDQPASAPQASAAFETDQRRGAVDCDRINAWRSRRREQSPISRSSTQTSATSTDTSPATTINLSREYTLAVQTNSYNEVWSKIHQCHREELEPDTGKQGEEGNSPSASTAGLVTRILQPDRESIQEVLRTLPLTRLTQLVSQYLESSEHTSHFCLSLWRAVERARCIYAPVNELLDLLPNPPAAAATDHHPLHLTQAQCDWAFDIFFEFDRSANPFPAPSSVEGSSCRFQGMRGCFPELKQQLDLRLLHVRRRHRLLRSATQGSGACLIASTVGLVVTGLVFATHALVTLMAGPAFFLCGCRPNADLLAGTRRRLRENMAQLEAASRGVYVLNNDLDTIERLVARLHATIESDRVLMRLGLDRGRGQRHPIEEVVCQLRKNHPSFLHQLEDLKEHICLYFAAVNPARSVLLQQIQQYYCQNS